MADEYATKPTIETILERIDRGFTELNARLDRTDERIDQMDTRLDRTQAMVHDLRSDFRELKAQLKEHLPALK
jgi:peptidoglycan hydrolase CwlO-like protein